jgi:hypothetical protein
MKMLFAPGALVAALSLRQRHFPGKRVLWRLRPQR